MEPKFSLALEEIDLSEPTLWGRPIEEREGAFATLRREDPIRFFEEQEMPEGFPLERGPGYYALTKHEHSLEASRNPQIYCSSRGATSIADLPPEMNEFFGGLINMDDPRHSRQPGPGHLCVA